MQEGAIYKRIFRDTVQAFSVGIYKNSTVYIKHLGLCDQVELEDVKLGHFEKAKSRGIPTEEEMLEFLREQGSWTTEDDREISESEAYIDRLIYNKRNLYLKSQLTRQDQLISEARQKIQKKYEQKKDLVGNTCESYAEKRGTDYYIMKSFYHEKDFKNPIFEESKFDDVASQELLTVSGLYTKVFEKFTDYNFQKLVLEDFFGPLMSLCENSVEFFGKPVALLTHYQLRLLVYTKMFKNILQSEEEIPVEMRNDPERLMDWARNPKGRERAKETLNKAEGGGAGIFGATKDDLKSLGVDGNDPGNVSLEQAVKDKGGSLSMKDLMKLSGFE